MVPFIRRNVLLARELHDNDPGFLPPLVRMTRFFSRRCNNQRGQSDIHYLQVLVQKFQDVCIRFRMCGSSTGFVKFSNSDTRLFGSATGLVQFSMRDVISSFTPSIQEDIDVSREENSGWHIVDSSEDGWHHYGFSMEHVQWLLLSSGVFLFYWY